MPIYDFAEERRKRMTTSERERLESSERDSFSEFKASLEGVLQTRGHGSTFEWNDDLLVIGATELGRIAIGNYLIGGSPFTPTIQSQFSGITSVNLTREGIYHIITIYGGSVGVGFQNFEQPDPANGVMF